MNRLMPCSNVDLPNMPSNSCPATAGSSSAACTVSRALAQAPTGSSSTEGPGDTFRPMSPMNMPCVSSMCWSRSLAVHSSQGVWLDHRSAGTASTREVNSAARRR